MNRSRDPIRAVTFDVGGTLIQPWPSVGHVYATVAAEFGLAGLNPGDLNRQFAAAWRRREDFDYARASWLGLVDETFAGLCPKPPGQDCFEAMYERFAHAPAWRIFEDVRPALQQLRSRQLKLGVISNFDERLRPLLARLELAEWFEVIVVSHDLQCPKPAAALFSRAAHLLGTPAHEILHVGDSATEDAAGARAAGFKSILIDRGEAGRRPGSVQRLDELWGHL